MLAVIETDKAAMEMEAYDEGVLTRILVAGGSIGPDRHPDRRHRRRGGCRSFRAVAGARSQIIPNERWFLPRRPRLALGRGAPAGRPCMPRHWPASSPASAEST